VLAGEIDLIVTLAQRQEYVDLSHRILAVTAWDQGLFQASCSTVYRVLKERNLMTARGPGGAHNGNSKAPVRTELTGPKPQVESRVVAVDYIQQGLKTPVMVKPAFILWLHKEFAFADIKPLLVLGCTNQR
jgi:hypothetical protein